MLWGKRGEALAKIISKGSRVYVEGRIETRSYEDANGVKKSATDIVATNLILLGSRGEGPGVAGKRWWWRRWCPTGARGRRRSPGARRWWYQARRR